MAPTISVIIPVLNEQERLAQRLTELAAMPGILEVIVVDGGSEDATLAVAARFPLVRVLTADRGRASQMNTGARAANGEVLLFLHADVMLPADAARHVTAALSAEDVVAGAFKTWTIAEETSRLIAPFLHLADLRSRYSRYPYGDQALFVRAAAFHRAGGFPAQPLMEDLALSRSLWRFGRVQIAAASVRVSGRRFLARPIYYTAVVNLFPLLYRLGVSPHVLAKWYGNPR